MYHRRIQGEPTSPSASRPILTIATGQASPWQLEVKHQSASMKSSARFFDAERETRLIHLVKVVLEADHRFYSWRSFT